ncbi:MAG TPA: exopolyphosphatase, partial [Micromonosporaceae bacterium]|nr:exopolyphosphatase [Micromonosporaceae bacterium]
GSSVITKHDGTGGLVSAGTVTAQLLYEIGEPSYLNPDVTAHFDTIQLAQTGPDQVTISGTTGSPPPPTLKVAVNMLGGYRNTMTMVLTGLDIEAKAAHAEQLLFAQLGGADQFDEVDVRLLRFDQADAPTNEQATAHLRITVKDQDERKVGRAFSDVTWELALGGYAGFHTTTPPTAASAFGVYWPTLVPASEITHLVHLPDGTSHVIPHSSQTLVPVAKPQPAMTPSTFPGERVSVALGRLCGARSGDKGGNANVGLWTRTDPEYDWLRQELTIRVFRKLVPEAADLEVRRYELPNLRALNFVVVGLLDAGVAATARPDAQAKGLGEYLRSRTVRVPANLLEEA